MKKWTYIHKRKGGEWVTERTGAIQNEKDGKMEKNGRERIKSKV